MQKSNRANRATRRQATLQAIRYDAEQMQSEYDHADRLLRRLFARSAKHRKNRLKRMH
jgi:hypothetical protein